MKKALPFLLGAIALLAIAAGLFYYKTFYGGRNAEVFGFIRNPEKYPDWVIPAGTRCGDAPFILPSEGFIGYLWQDHFKLFEAHQGLDIFPGTKVGESEVYAAYDGYLTREPGWKSTLAIRVPDDPLQSGRQIWLYMTHLADADGKSLIDAKFPEGSREIPVKQGELLGRVGNWSGTPKVPVGVHLHFSIVKDDGNGQIMNELKVQNTLDPSPYFGMDLDARSAGKTIPSCLP